ncbi:MAG: hypothetical protein AB1742_08470, partial [bacterium]
ERPDPGAVERVDVYASLLTVKMDDFSRAFVRHEASSPVTVNFYLPYNVAAGIMDGELTPVQFTPNRIRDTAVWNLARRVRVHHDLHLTGLVLDELARIIDMRYVVRHMNWRALSQILRQVGPAPFSRIAGYKPIHETLRDAANILYRSFKTRAETRQGEFVPDDIASFRMNFGARVRITLKNGRVLESEQDVPYGAAGRPLEEKRIEVIRKFRQEAALSLPGKAVGHAINRISDFENLDHAAVRNLVQICAGATEPGKARQQRAAL